MYILIHTDDSSDYYGEEDKLIAVSKDKNRLEELKKSMISDYERKLKIYKENVNAQNIIKTNWLDECKKFLFKNIEHSKVYKNTIDNAKRVYGDLFDIDDFKLACVDQINPRMLFIHKACRLSEVLDLNQVKDQIPEKPELIDGNYDGPTEYTESNLTIEEIEEI